MLPPPTGAVNRARGPEQQAPPSPDPGYVLLGGAVDEATHNSDQEHHDDYQGRDDKGERH